MNNFPKLTTILIVVISIVTIVSCALFKSLKEGLTNNHTIVLIGDSILNNSIYVSSEKSVFDILQTKTQHVFEFAKDGATIRDCYEQLDKIPTDLNTTETYIFISAGGNDILNRRGQLTGEEIKKLFNDYMNFIKALRVKLSSAKINILNLYMPSNPRYQSYKSSIDQWNNLIKEYSSKVGEMYNVIDLFSLLTTSQDFVYDIEPSEIASQKIATAIYFTR